MKRVVFSAKTRVTMRRDRSALAQMRVSERLPEDQLQRLTDERSAAIALHAYKTTEFYRDHYQSAGFNERDIAESSNFTSLPALTKEDVRRAGDALISLGSSRRDRLPSRTGGSTGSPLVVYNDRNAPTAALWWRVYGWWGVHAADDSAFIYRQSRAGMKKLLYDAEWWPTRHILLDARGATAQSIAEFDRVMSRVQPKLLVGYVEGVADYAAHVRDAGLRSTGLVAVSVTASMLHPGQRQLIQESLGAPVYDTYRSAEIPWIAAECGAHQGLHVLGDHRRVDIVDAEGAPAEDDAVGDVLVTDFGNRVFPLVRYMIGDRSSRMPGVCDCGRSLPRISALQGRIADVLRTPSGRTVSGGLGGLFNRWPQAVRQFQVHQAQDFTVTIRMVPGRERETALRAAEEVARTVSGFLADEVPVRAAEVDSIENVGGKSRLVVSEAPKPE